MTQELDSQALDQELEEELQTFESEPEQDVVEQVATNPNHYVNNNELLEEFKKYKAKYDAWVEGGKEGPKPRLSEKIGKAILQIATKRCNSRQYVRYTQLWKEEMINDAVEVCVRYAHNFNPEKSSNPFSYLTTTVNNAIKQRIKKEHDNQYIKAKSFDNAHGVFAEIDSNNINEEDVEHLNETHDMYRDRLEYIQNFEEKRGLNKKKATKPSDPNQSTLYDDGEENDDGDES